MVSVLPATVAGPVRTVAAACWLAAGRLLAGELVAAAAVIPPPMAAAAARLMLAMMILGCRLVELLGILTTHYLLIRLVEGGGSLTAVISAWARARTWSPVTVSCSSRAAV